MLTLLSFLFACYLYSLGHIVVHMCAHRTLARSPRVNWLVGNLISSLHLMVFSGWRAAHVLHHRYTNTERDPHRVDCGMLKYLLTHYYKLSKNVWDAAAFWKSVGPPLVIYTGLLIWGFSSGFGEQVVRYGLLYWLGPLFVSHMLMAHFNYATHVGLPEGRGQDTRSLNRGLMKLVNRLTFNFYYHEEHHLAPGYAAPTPARDQRAAKSSSQA